MKIEYIILGIIVILILLILGFQIISINIFGITFGKQQKPESVVTTTIPITTTTINPEGIWIESFESDQKIWKPNSNVTIHFTIMNKVKLPYNITADWLYRDTRYHGWFNRSTEIYPIENETNTYVIWYPIDKIGEWRVQLFVQLEYKNVTYKREEITKFEVV